MLLLLVVAVGALAAEIVVCRAATKARIIAGTVIAAPAFALVALCTGMENLPFASAGFWFAAAMSIVVAICELRKNAAEQ